MGYGKEQSEPLVGHSTGWMKHVTQNQHYTGVVFNSTKMQHYITDNTDIDLPVIDPLTRNIACKVQYIRGFTFYFYASFDHCGIRCAIIDQTETHVWVVRETWKHRFMRWLAMKLGQEHTFI